MFDPQELKKDFPILLRQINGRPLVYLDNAATSQKPQQVIEAITSFYTQHNANVHRGVHTLSDESTADWHQSRKTISEFFGCEDEELILLRNTTEAMNGMVYGWGVDHLMKGDVICVSQMDHHSSIVPWQQLCHRVGARLEFVNVTQEGRLDIDDFKLLLEKFQKKLKAVVLPHVSNALGTLNPVEKIVQLVRESRTGSAWPLIIIDGAQSAPHIPIDFQKLDVDAFIFSGHKMLGPMGCGGLIIKKALLLGEVMKPWLFGGGMISAVYEQHTQMSEDLADRFTAGTPDVASAVGLAAACKYLNLLGMKNVEQHDQGLVQYALEGLTELPELKILGPRTPQLPNLLDRVGSVSFEYQGVHAHDVAQILDAQGIAVRSGHHCTMPLHTKFDWVATIRASFQVYNTKQDIDRLIEALGGIKHVFRR